MKNTELRGPDDGEPGRSARPFIGVLGRGLLISLPLWGVIALALFLWFRPA